MQCAYTQAGRIEERVWVKRFCFEARVLKSAKNSLEECYVMSYDPVQFVQGQSTFRIPLLAGSQWYQLLFISQPARVNRSALEILKVYF